MTPSTILTMIVGLVLPALVIVVTKQKLSPTWKALILLLFSTASGVLSGVATSPPSTLTEWEHVAVNIILTYVCAAAAYVAAEHSGVGPKLTKRTANFGIGPTT